MDKYEECKKLTGTLKRNRENVPVEELKTKYAASYNKLLEDIRKLSSEIMTEMCFGDLPFAEEDGDEITAFVSRAQKVIDEEAEKGVYREIASAIFKDFDLDKAMDIIAVRLKERIQFEAYTPYWIKHCKKVDGVYYNDLIDKWWDDRYGLWFDKDHNTCTIMYPPTKIKIKKEYDGIKAEKSAMS